jgi:hypothetical protein
VAAALNRLLGGAALGESTEPQTAAAPDGVAPSDGDGGKDLMARASAVAEPAPDAETEARVLPSKPEIALSPDRPRTQPQTSGPVAAQAQATAAISSRIEQPSRAEPAAPQVLSASTTLVTGQAAQPTFMAEPTPPSVQVARRIVAEVVSLGQAPSAPAVEQAGPDGLVRVLHLELEPANLGSVTVRMTLKDNTISLHLEASRHETAVALSREHEALSSALKSAGYVVDSVTSQPVDPPRAVTPAPSGSADAQLSSSFQQQAGLGQSGRRNPGEDSRQSPDRRYGDGGGVNDGRAGVSRTDGDAIYV